MFNGIHKRYSPALLGPRLVITDIIFDAEQSWEERWDGQVDCECSYQGIINKFRAEVKPIDDVIWQPTGRTEEKLNNLSERTVHREYVCIQDEPKFTHTNRKFGAYRTVLGRKDDRVWLPDSFALGQRCVQVAGIITAEYAENMLRWRIGYPTYLVYATTPLKYFLHRYQHRYEKDVLTAAYKLARSRSQVASFRMALLHSDRSESSAFLASVGLK